MIRRKVYMFVTLLEPRRKIIVKVKRYSRLPNDRYFRNSCIYYPKKWRGKCVFEFMRSNKLMFLKCIGNWK